MFNIIYNDKIWKQHVYQDIFGHKTDTENEQAVARGERGQKKKNE